MLYLILILFITDITSVTAQNRIIDSGAFVELETRLSRQVTNQKASFTVTNFIIICCLNKSNLNFHKQ